ncbi:hypothetical protein G6O69_34085 [Pseudenhygromyxa sp. WMMC2535]|uniref:hypothetical protein n=1 Tax=Pseudenhygromyxa sp. WMMC2535 TaxID=2712867 RepID=UPI001557FFB7|nr:hypothetical protein [Pseudenhygromyxa sp. WMMC2535]NVB42901.1 hypothetical protein [Pseudenhygromyxa sp. WMMC2535]
MSLGQAEVRTGLGAAALLAVVLAGCGGETEEAAKPSGERRAAPEPETPKEAPSGPFGAYDFAAAAKRFEGAWVVPGLAPGGETAWFIEGDELVEFDGESEHRYAFTIYSPCQVALTDADAGETTYRPFTFVGDALHVGVASSTGVVIGDETVACVMGQVYVLEAGGRCSAWSEIFDDWKREDAECEIEGEGASRQLVVGDRRLRFEGEGLYDDNSKTSVARRESDFAAAKAALASAP